MNSTASSGGPHVTNALESWYLGRGDAVYGCMGLPLKSGCWWPPVGQGYLLWAARCGHSTAYPLGCSLMPVLGFPLSLRLPSLSDPGPPWFLFVLSCLFVLGTQEADDFPLLLSFQEMGKILPGSRKQYNCPGTWPGVKGVPKISESRKTPNQPHPTTGDIPHAEPYY